MHIYLTHLIHGAKVAISDAGAEHDEQNGWSRYNPEAPPVEGNALSVKRGPRRKSTEPESVTEGN